MDWKLTPLLIEEITGNGGFTHMAVFSANNLTEEATNTAQVLTGPTVKAGFIINKAMARLVTPFEDEDDNAYNSTTLTVGDDGDADRYIASAQLNRNGTEITVPAFNNTAYMPTAGATLQVTFGSMTGKSLNNLDKGEVHFFVQIIDTDALSSALGNTPILK